jgi:RNA processing factor Prp31
VDCYGSGRKSDVLKADLARRVDEIKKQSPRVPRKTQSRQIRR